MTQVLYRRWRPMTFEEVVGQEHVTHTLRSALMLGRVGHAYLFAGPRGTGKTTTARLLAKAVNCLAEEMADRPCNQCRVCQAINEGRFLDLIEIDAASNTGVDDVRDLREKIGFSPNEGRYKVYIIDEVHMLSTAAFNALLKTLEEPPPHAILILATTEAHKIPATVLSRCQRFEFRRIPLVEIVGRLRRLLEHEGATAEPAALDLIARQATGALRDAESLLDQLLASHSGAVTLEQAQAVLGTATNEAVAQVIDAWIANDPSAGLAAIQHAVESGTDPRQFARQIVDTLRGILHLQTGGAIPVELPESVHESLRRQASALGTSEVIASVRRFSTAMVEAKSGWQPQLPLELALIEAINERMGPADEAPTPSERPAPAQEMETAPSHAVPVAAEPVGEEIAAGVEAPSARPVDQIRAQWDALKAAVKRRNFRVEALLNSGEVLGVEGRTVVLGFPYSFHRDKMSSDEYRQVVDESLAELHGGRYTIRCVDPAAYQSTESAGGAPGLDSDEIKRFAVEELNAQIVKKKES
jgi:DNA polymerase-3 subunit gamma/tau